MPKKFRVIETESRIIVVDEFSLDFIKAYAKNADRLVYGFQTPWWKVGNPCYTTIHRLPCGPRSEMLLETDKPLDFIAQAEANPTHYGKHGLRAFVAAYHGNLIVESNKRPTSFDSWDQYNEAIDGKESGT